MLSRVLTAVLALSGVMTAAAQAQEPLRPDQVKFREVYKELV